MMEIRREVCESNKKNTLSAYIGAQARNRIEILYWKEKEMI